jgi:uncharacterized protein YndB with AHSA1/START domain
MNKELKIEQKIYLEANREDVWDALVNPVKIKKYFFGTDTLSDWKVGSEIIFTGEYQGEKYREGGIITELIPDEKLTYTYWTSFWNTEDIPENHSLITYQLSSFGAGTELILKQQGFQDLEAQQHSMSSWDTVLNGLKEVIEKEPA